MARLVRISRNDGCVNFLKGKKLCFSTWFWDASPFSEGVSVVETRDSQGNIDCRFIKDNGKYLTKESFYCAWPFHNGYAIVQRDFDMKFNFINHKGKTVFENWYKELWDFEIFANGIYAVAQRDDNLVNFVRPDGTLVSEVWFSSIFTVDENNVAEVALKNNEKAIFDFNDFSIHIM